MAEVRAALQEVIKADATLRITEVVTPSDDILTAKLGSLIPLIGTGTYTRIGFADVPDGSTQIVVKVFAYLIGPNGIGPDPDADRNKKRAERLQAALAAQLGVEVK